MMVGLGIMLWGLALAFDPKKKTVGVVNEKLQVVVPVIYEKIDTREEEGRNNN